MDEDDFKQIKWDEIRDYYQVKKLNWAKGKSYYQGNPEWGTQKMFGSNEPSGFYLKPAYTDEEIKKYEETLKINLPEDLRLYLTLVSRELQVTSYPIVFSLSTTLPWEGPGFMVPEGKTIWDFDSCLEHGKYPQFPAPHTKENNYGSCECDADPTDGRVTVGEGGCTDTDTLVIKGLHLGSVWRVGCGGDTLFKSYDNFWDYIYSPIKSEKDREERRNRPMTDEELVSMTINYNALRIMSGLGGLKYNN
jgi:hypothetical protein